jgi:hypothetical protein
MKEIQINNYEELIKYIENTPTYNRWDWVEVSDNGVDWKVRIYLTIIEWAKCPYVCVNRVEHEEFLSKEEFDITLWKYIRPIKKEEKKERKLMMTDSEWEEFRKRNNLHLKD